MSSIRKDYILNRWTIFSPIRAKRPHELEVIEAEKKEGECPFCPGREDRTPPASLVYIEDEKGVRKDRDSELIRLKNWSVRCFPNLYPALSPSASEDVESGAFLSMKPIGFHEVLVESPRHFEHPDKARIEQLKLVINALIDRLNFFSSKEFIQFVSIFRNHGLRGGATISHAHMQLIAMPLIPSLISEELKSSKEYFEREGRCPFCDLIEKEEKGPRLIHKNEYFMALCPWASTHPYEFWIIPLRHMSNLMEMSDEEIISLARIIRKCFGGLSRALKDPAYNAGFHIAPLRGRWNFYHWHLEVYPRLSILGGFEKSTGMFINTVFPEKAADELRKFIESEG